LWGRLHGFPHKYYEYDEYEFGLFEMEAKMWINIKEGKNYINSGEIY
jgi:hypothetical protein